MSGKPLKTYFEERQIPNIYTHFIECGIDEKSLLSRIKMGDLHKWGIKDKRDQEKVYAIIKEIQNEMNTPVKHDYLLHQNKSDDKSVLEYNEVSFSDLNSSFTENSFMKNWKNSKITVCVRKRPIRNNQTDIVTVEDGMVVVEEPKVKLDLEEYSVRHSFPFDFTFDEKSKNEDIYSGVVEEIVNYVLAGGNGTVIAYGQTGTGKTHTLFHPSCGLVLIAISDFIKREGKGKLAFYEIYNGQLYDLLNYRQKGLMREAEGNIVLFNIEEISFTAQEDAMSLINQGLNSRMTGVTGANSESSRSHAIIRITGERGGTMVFVDLAGSERGSDRKMVNSKIKNEGAEINKSLLVLKECIRGMDMHSQYLPFRQSKLTQVLKNSFIGASHTCVIATISPNRGDVDHTLNTLRYAFRIKGDRVTRPTSSKTIISEKASQRFRRHSFDEIHRRCGSPVKKESSSPSEELIRKRVNFSLRKISNEVESCHDISALEKVSELLNSIEYFLRENKFK
ncbi:Kinesin-like protein KIF24 [Astathelohania contejeani]|uniref:Kinesin-like protein n=1 Tax=Astathelohania contejeani TaxID=164912 RepID=A0ABQ7I170_9MICR|nr:Kinesin-like protein KIF24 [Thelohania contejeani]